LLEHVDVVDLVLPYTFLSIRIDLVDPQGAARVMVVADLAACIGLGRLEVAGEGDDAFNPEFKDDVGVGHARYVVAAESAPDGTVRVVELEGDVVDYPVEK